MKSCDSMMFYQTFIDLQIIILLFICLPHYSGSYSLEQTRSNPTASLTCEYFSALECAGNQSLCETSLLTCDVPDDHTKRSHCFAFWHYANKSVDGGGFAENRDVIEIVHKGCWLDTPACYDRLTCTADKYRNDNYFCCCEGHMCNVNISANITIDARATGLSSGQYGDVMRVADRKTVLRTLLFSLLPLVIIAFLSVILFWLYRVHRRTNDLNDQSDQRKDQPLLGTFLNTSPTNELPSLINGSDVKLLEVKAKGRSSNVWKAQMGTSDGQIHIAVKVVGLGERASWLTERSLYSLAGMRNHDNILCYIDGLALDLELWIVTEYHERGSLYDYLKSSTVEWNTMTHIASGVASGLTFLHSVTQIKPAIAHRDLKTRNVLLKRDLTPCIGDFGLALALEGILDSECYTKVGTTRYMAPEVLHGCITFSSEFILKMDIYSASLIFYELLSRCTAASGPVREYTLPYENEVGLHPSMEEMKEVVDTKRIRPPIEQHWYHHKGMASFCDMLEDCWDPDPDARLTAECIYDRIAQLIILSMDFAPDILLSDRDLQKGSFDDNSTV